MNPMKVSVIVPVYNTELYLEECIQSICNQTLKEIEIICVDDGSTDSSIEIIQRLAEKDSRIQLLQQENRGGGAARNLGMKKAQGDYLMFLDSDDFFQEDLLEKLWMRCEETKADISICKVKCYHVDLGFDTPEPAAMREEFLPEKEVFCWKDMPEAIFNSFHNWPWNKMFSRAFVEKKQLSFQEIKRTNDLLFTCKALMEAERIAVVKEELVNYRVGMSTNCQSTNTETPLDFYHAFLALKTYLVEKGVFEQVERSFVNHALDGCIANLNSMENSSRQKELYDKLKNEIFEQLSVKKQPETYYHEQNRRMYTAYCVMMEGEYPDYLKNRIRELKEERDLFLISAHTEKMNAYAEWLRVQGLYKEKLDLLSCREYKIGTKILYWPLKVRNLFRKKEEIS